MFFASQRKKKFTCVRERKREREREMREREREVRERERQVERDRVDQYGRTFPTS